MICCLPTVYFNSQNAVHCASPHALRLQCSVALFTPMGAIRWQCRPPNATYYIIFSAKHWGHVTGTAFRDCITLFSWGMVKRIVRYCLTSFSQNGNILHILEWKASYRAFNATVFNRFTILYLLQDAGGNQHKVSVSPVVHVRGLCESVVEADLMEALSKFGTIW